MLYGYHYSDLYLLFLAIAAVSSIVATICCICINILHVKFFECIKFIINSYMLIRVSDMCIGKNKFLVDYQLNFIMIIIVWQQQSRSQPQGTPLHIYTCMAIFLT